MPRSCSICGVGSRAPGVALHELPSEEGPRRQWADVITVLAGEVRTPEWRTVNYTVCSGHFQPADYRDDTRFRTLRPGAIPSVLGPRGRRQQRGRRGNRRVAANVALPAPAVDVQADGARDEEVPGDAAPAPVVAATTVAPAGFPVTAAVVGPEFDERDLELAVIEAAATATPVVEQCPSGKEVPPPPPPPPPRPRTPRLRPPSPGTGLQSARRVSRAMAMRLGRWEARIARLQKTVWEARKKEVPRRPEAVAFDTVLLQADRGDVRAQFLVEQVTNFGKKKPRWSEPFIRECVLLQAVSGPTYEAARASPILQGAPSATTLKRYLGCSTGEVGVTKDVVNRLEAEVEHLGPMERPCTVIIDEMAHSEKAVYDSKLDQVFGLDNLASGGDGGTGRRTLANKLLCVVIHGVTTEYTIPVLEVLCRVGFIPIRICADNARANTALFRKLGGGKLQTNVPHPFLSGMKLFISFDPCHIMKNLRSQLIDLTMSDEEGTGEITGTFVAELYALQKRDLVKPVRGFSRRHVAPSSIEKQNVMRAKQYFAKPVTDTLRFLQGQPAADPHAFKFRRCLPTVVYMENVRKWFEVHDVCNKEFHFKDINPNIKPFFCTDDDRLQWLENEFLDYLRVIKQKSRERGMAFLTTETYEALVFTSRSTAEFVRYLLDGIGILFVLTRKLQSDPVESTISTTRRLCGGNDMVDARAAVFAMEKILRLGTLRTSKYSNVGAQAAVRYRGNVRRPAVRVLPLSHMAEIPDRCLAILDGLKDVTRSVESSLRNASVALVASYLLTCLEERIDRECLAALRTEDGSPSPVLGLLRAMDKGKSPYPSTSFLKVTLVIKDFCESAMKSIDMVRFGVRGALAAAARPALSACPLVAAPCGHGEQIVEVVLEKLLSPPREELLRSPHGQCEAASGLEEEATQPQVHARVGVIQQGL
ncbi:hypothetical protein ONE63_007350 [Megalurothrips usitatus]|uniref:THAP-type domain-containing protein n=1 Tax=Megalurothrips usitatus TaxID=439358 RepID=A0AAV7XV84_9NEOP|nr:hypothetical protein ONE63_007350 [Megalurothrips usitatus]